MEKLEELLKLFPNSKQIIIAVEEKDATDIISTIGFANQTTQEGSFERNETSTSLIYYAAKYKGVDFFFVNDKELISRIK